MSEPRRGEVVRVPLLSADRTRYLLHPALVIQDPQLKGPFDKLLVAAITSRVRRSPTRILVETGSPDAAEMGLRLTSQVCLDDLSAVPTFAMQVVGGCPFMGDVDGLLRRILRLG